MDGINFSATVTFSCKQNPLIYNQYWCNHIKKTFIQGAIESISGQVFIVIFHDSFLWNHCDHRDEGNQVYCVKFNFGELRPKFALLTNSKPA